MLVMILENLKKFDEPSRIVKRHYTGAIFIMQNNGIITEEEMQTQLLLMEGKLSPYVFNLHKSGWSRYQPDIISIDDARLQKRYNEGLLRSLLSVNVSLLNKYRVLAEQAGFPLNYYLKLLQLSGKFAINEAELNKIKNTGKELISLIRRTNRKAERAEQRINLIELELYHLHNLASLQIISPELTKELVYNRCQRGYLPLLEKDIKAVSSLDSKYIAALRKSIRSLQSKKAVLTPLFMMQIINFANMYNVYAEMGLNSDIFQEALLRANTKEEAVFNLGEGIIKELVKQFKVEVNLEDEETVKRVLKEWHLGYLGSMVSASRRWSGDDAELFKLVIRTALEGKFHALLYPDEYTDVSFSNYSEEDQDVIKKIRAYNYNFRREVKKNGVNDTWLHPEKIPPKLTTKEAVLMRNWQVVLKDFSANLKNFLVWFDGSPLSEDLRGKLDKAMKSLGPFNKLLEDDPKLSVGLLNQKNNLNKLLEGVPKFPTVL